MPTCVAPRLPPPDRTNAVVIAFHSSRREKLGTARRPNAAPTPLLAAERTRTVGGVLYGDDVPVSSSHPLPTPAYDVSRVVLDNGLRVLLAPDRTSPVVGVAVHYDVGFRSEPEGRTGFAH